MTIHSYTKGYPIELHIFCTLKGKIIFSKTLPEDIDKFMAHRCKQFSKIFESFIDKNLPDFYCLHIITEKNIFGDA